MLMKMMRRDRTPHDTGSRSVPVGIACKTVHPIRLPQPTVTFGR
jgi:hypothetical protein